MKDKQRWRRPRAKEVSDAEMLSAWCHWKRLEVGLSEEDLDFVTAIENVVSQVGNWKAKCERAERKGAEWMRERAAKACDKEGFARVGWDAKALVASRIIRALPLPGDEVKG